VRASLLLAGLALLAVPASTGAQDSGAAEMKPARFEHMLRGYCYAGSRIADPDALGGFGPSDNFPIPMPEGVDVKAGTLALVAVPDTPAIFRGTYAGMTLYLVNATREVLPFHASDSRLSIIQEAQDEKGEWRPVEYLPSSFCGNSYHKLMLGPREAWRFAAPRYTGSLKTTLRFRLDRGAEDGGPLYSNTFAGGVNPEQFTVKEGHRPSNVMDPYDE
jgi:hypothetical protein